MTTEPKMPPLPFAVFDEFGKGADDRVQDHMTACCKQWAERVAELDRVLGVARDAIAIMSEEIIATIDAARSKEGQHHD